MPRAHNTPTPTSEQVPEAERLWTSKAAARYLEVSETWLGNMRTGTGGAPTGPKFQVIDGRYWYKKSDLDMWKLLRDAPSAKVVGVVRDPWTNALHLELVIEAPSGNIVMVATASGSEIQPDIGTAEAWIKARLAAQEAP